MSQKGNQKAATYKKDIVLSFINQFPNATTMAISRLIYDKHKLDFTSLDLITSYRIGLQVRSLGSLLDLDCPFFLIHLRRSCEVLCLWL